MDELDNLENLVRAVIDWQSALREELLGELHCVQGRLDKMIGDLESRIDDLDKRLTVNLGRIRAQLANGSMQRLSKRCWTR